MRLIALLFRLGHSWTNSCSSVIGEVVLAKQKRRKKRNKKASAKKHWLRRVLVAAVVVAVLAVVLLDIVVYTKFQGKKWSLPAHVYSRALDLYAGMPLGRDQFLWELDQLGYRRTVDARAPGQVSVAGERVNMVTRGFSFWDAREPSQKLRLQFDGGHLRRLTDSAGDAITITRLEPVLIGGIYPAHREDRELVRLEELPLYLADGLVAVEDRLFYEHFGLSFRGIARAMKANLQQGRMAQGGSTLTQQLVKNFYLTQERTLSRKLVEAAMSVLLELHFDKDEILETYLNEVYLGQSGNRGVHGFAMASRHYFQRPVGELELHQTALLIGLVKGASYYNPWRHPERALARRDLVLDVLAREGVAEQSSVDAAKRKPLGLVKTRKKGKKEFPGYLDLVKRQLREDYDEDDLRTEGLRIFTNFDPQVQRHLEASLTKRVGALEGAYKIEKDQLQAASVVVHVGTGEVVALVGDRQPGYAGFNRALDARRPVGSTIKPAVYLAALERPERYTLASLLDDRSKVIVTPDGQEWQPRNFSRESHGLVPLYEALAQSYNQAAAWLGMEVGIPAIIETIERMGFRDSLPEVPSLILGTAEMSPFQVAGIYHTIAANGFHVPLRAIRSVYTVENTPLKRYSYQVEQRFDPATMHLLQYAMQASMREGTGRRAYLKLPEDIRLAGKTGTTNDQRDSWFAGFSGSYLNVVWLGKDDNGKMPLTGGTGALRVWTDFMAGMEHQSLAFSRPDDVQYHWIEPGSGLLSAERCTGARYVPFVGGSEPEERGACSNRGPARVVDWLKDVIGW